MKKIKPYKRLSPICPFDKMDCYPNMDGYLDCSNCPRHGNGVRATGEMLCLEIIYNSFRKLFKLK